MYLLLIILLATNVFSNIEVNIDNSAFMTKAEFESIKSNIQSQLYQYNNFIDNKIDAAISSYLAGVKITAVNYHNVLLKNTDTNYVISFDEDHPLDFVFGWPRISLDLTEARIPSGSNHAGFASVTADAIAISDKTKSKKTVIENLAQYNSIWSAEFEGYHVGCDDLIDLYFNILDRNQTIAGSTNSISYIAWAKQGSGNKLFIKNENINTGSKVVGCSIRTSSANNDSDSYSTSPIYQQPYIRSLTHDWGTNEYPYAICWKPYEYDMFSNKDRDYNLGYDGNYMTSFDEWSNMSFTQASQHIANFMSKSTQTPSVWWGYVPNGGTPQSGSKNLSFNQYMAAAHGTTSGKFFIPMIGFETTYLKNWNQIYQKDTNEIAAFDKSKYSESIEGSIIQTASDTYSLSVSAGLPIIYLGEKESLDNFSVEFRDKTKDYIIWVSERPFSNKVNPYDASNLVTIKKLERVNDLNGYKIKNGEGHFGYNNDGKEKYLYIKWGILNNDTSCTCGGEIKFESTYTTKTDF